MAYSGPLGTPQDEPFWSPEPVQGWRMWTLRGNNLVGNFGQPWRTGQIEAIHASDLRGSTHREHDAPDPDCRCGVNAYDTWERLVSRESTDHHEAVIGLIDMWGKVIQHEQGYRAQHAKIMRLWVVLDPERMQFIEDALPGTEKPPNANTLRPLELTPAAKMARTLATLRDVFTPNVELVNVEALRRWAQRPTAGA